MKATSEQDHTIVVVADTTPILYLARIGVLHLVPRLYGRVLVPGIVWAELVEARPDAPGVPLIRAAEWIIVDDRADQDPLVAELAEEVDAGEAAAIALAVVRHADLLLVDDLDARRVAVERGLHVRGTVGLLMGARALGHVDALRPLLDALMAEGFRLDRELYVRALSSVGEEPR